MTAKENRSHRPKLSLQEELSGKGRADVTHRLGRQPSTEGVPLSLAQQRLWFLHQLEPTIPLCNLAQAFRLNGPLDSEILAQGLSEIVRRHEVLRSRFLIRDGAPVQTVDPPGPLNLAVVNLQHLGHERREEELNRRLTNEAQRTFDLGGELMLRGRLFRLSRNEHILLLTLHQIAADPWSIGLLLDELAKLYNARRRGQAASLPELPIQYADFCVWQRQQLPPESFEDDVAFWNRQLPPPMLPTWRGAAHSRQLNLELLSPLKDLAAQEGATLFMLLLAAFQIMLHDETGQEEVVVYSPFFGRYQPETEHLIGQFLNTLVLRTDSSGNPTVREFLQRVREVAVTAYSRHELPFETRAEEIQAECDASRLFQILFTLQHMAGPLPEFADLQLQPVDVDLGVVTYDLILITREIDAGLLTTLEYKTDLFEPGAIDGMLGHFQSLLERIVANPNQRLSELPLRSPEMLLRHRGQVSQATGPQNA